MIPARQLVVPAGGNRSGGRGNEAVGVFDERITNWGKIIDYPATVSIYICHAMPMKEKQLRQYRKIRRQSRAIKIS
jgi:hypothetical protein